MKKLFAAVDKLNESIMRFIRQKIKMKSKHDFLA